MLGKVMLATTSYYGKDTRMIDHSLKVFAHAQTIALCEKLTGEDLEVALCGAMMHDIGIPESMAQHGSAAPEYQEKLGAIEGNKLLQSLNCPDHIRERIVFLIANHHSLHVDGGLPLQILFEADFIVNLIEHNFPDLHPEDVYQKHFKTSTSKRLMQSIFNL